MAKTKRHKTNRSPRKLFANSEVRVVVAGQQINCNGHHAGDTIVAMKTTPNAKAKPIFVNRRVTGVPAGKIYPYAGAKRGGIGGATKLGDV